MKFNIMDSTGHTTVEYSESETKAAMAKFRELVDEHKMSVAKMDAGGPGKHEIITSRSPEGLSPQDELLFIPQLKGG